jgi:NAD-dependent oxidoreductase involved in siderophore biosynthesis
VRIHKSYIAIGLVIALGLFLAVIANASELNQKTTITFSAPVQIPGQVLSAGTYIFQQSEPDTNPNIIQIVNAQTDRGVAVLQTLPAERGSAAEGITVTLANTASGSPAYLVNWFYPGSLTGYRFVYPRQQQNQISQTAQQTVMANPVAVGE